MKLARARITPYRLPLLNPLETAHGVFRERQGCLLEVETDSGLLGHGDACPFPGFRMESPEALIPSLEVLAEALLGCDPRNGEEARARALAARPEAPGARFAMDCALHEVVSRAEGVSVAELLARESGSEAKAGCFVNALVSGLDTDALRLDVERASEEGFVDLKLKVGARTWEEDLARVHVVRETAGAERRLRLDVGEAWSLDDALKRLDPLAELGIDLIEQPLPAQDWRGMVSLRKKTRSLGIALAADEAIVRPEDARRIIEEGAADVLVLKPAALGGLASAAELASAGREAGLDCVVTSLIDSAWGRAAALALACSLPGSRPADGLATGSLLAFDLALSAVPTEGRLMRSEGMGFGLENDAAALERAGGDGVIEVRG
ncbi:MAG: mandelate racemase/muconate lactonizing enzyme family protein [Myxococcota bacterium]|nr:mandelate racemase/muconate lactonizing enzyme family protein [Myxococcota bacterium]